MRMKSLVGQILTLVVALTGVLSTAFADSSGSWIPQSANQSDQSFHSVTFKDPLPMQFNFSLLQATDGNSMFVCKSTSDPACAHMTFKYLSILKSCQSPTDIDCIASVTAIDSSGNSQPGAFSRYTVANHVNSYPADPKLGIAAGDTPSIWSIPGAPHASGNDYAIIAGESGYINPKDVNGPVKNNSSEYLDVSLVPVVLTDFGKSNSTLMGWSGPFLNGVYYDACHEFQQTKTRKNAECGHVNGDSCYLPTNDQGICYAEEAMTPGQKFNVHLRLSHEPSGWIHGRMTDPNISITHESSGPVDLSIAAGSVQVPLVYQGADWGTLPPSLQDYWVKCMNHGDQCGYVGAGAGAASDFWVVGSTLSGNAQLNLQGEPFSFGPLALQAMSAIAPLVGNKANTMTTSWNFRTLTNQEMKGADKCFTSTSGIKGIVSTNSTTYSQGPPVLANGSLNYQVSSTHFLPDGATPFKGTYNLIMRSDVARCLYGFSSAPISASISVISADGNNDVATTVAGEKNGWLSLSANNFEFSSPVIKVKLTQVGAKPKPVTIKCVSGKVAKSVTSLTPKCPVGFTQQ